LLPVIAVLLHNAVFFNAGLLNLFAGDLFYLVFNADWSRIAGKNVRNADFKKTLVCLTMKISFLYAW